MDKKIGKKLSLVREISEIRKRMSTMREENRRLRNELTQKNFKVVIDYFEIFKSFNLKISYQRLVSLGPRV
jgi:regulator of replication initiation timing